MRRLVKSIVVGVVALAMFVSIAAVAQASAQLRRPRPAPAALARGEADVAIVGDSITNLTGPTFIRELRGRGYPAPFVSGINGSRSDERVDEAPARLSRGRAAPTDVLVIELGTNDVGQFVHDHPAASVDDRDRHARTVADNVARLVERVEPAVVCVVIVNVSANTMSPEANDVARAENRALAEWVRRDPRAHLADWGALVADEFARGEPAGSITTDLVHPTPLGATRLADLVADTIDTSCASR